MSFEYVEDLKQWCHRNHHVFIKGNRNQDKPSIGCGEEVSNMFYNTLFQFGSILDDPSNTLSIIELIDNTIGYGIYNKDIKDSNWFPIKDEDYYLDAINHVRFLAYIYETRAICYGLP